MGAAALPCNEVRRRQAYRRAAQAEGAAIPESAVSCAALATPLPSQLAPSPAALEGHTSSTQELIG